MENHLLPLSAVTTTRHLGTGGAGLVPAGVEAGGVSAAETPHVGQSEFTHHAKGGRGDDRGKKVNERKRHIMVDAQGTILDAVVTPVAVNH